MAVTGESNVWGFRFEGESPALCEDNAHHEAIKDLPVVAQHLDSRITLTLVTFPMLTLT
jgi:hypothetical protein